MVIKKIFNRYLLRLFGNKTFPGSEKYWENRYKSGDNSGAGSYGKVATFKSKIINDFIGKNRVKSILEFGCGDGNQLSLFKVKKYIGLDISRHIIKKCSEKMFTDKTKSFFLYDPKCFIDNQSLFKSDLTLSLEIIFHIIEGDIFNLHMEHLFNSSNKYVIIYSSNKNSAQKYHVRHRNFTDWVSKNKPNWKLIKIIRNKFPDICFSDFYIFKTDLKK
ncbi:MAG: hypothetical protein Q7K55_01555 [Candidatus Levybacteria bacterium]|nr:hypothetical protein [Candidatus Levybacteria bacterium]